ncbi:MAG: hypothetical protein HY924_04890 [Elusimicrobia bacterium]|nr:hypothetical protein [Elusimicrobiota bacterium]
MKTAGSARAWELAAALAFAALTVLLFINKAYHADEPLYLPAARHILADPLHPFAFELNYYGRSVPYREINNTPPLLMYLLAGALKLTAGREWGMRLCFLPFDLAAAAALYLLAARFLKRPLLPVLIVLATPAYWINMGHLMPEKLALASGLWGLVGLLRWTDPEEPGGAGRRAAFWWSSGCMALALLSKYNAAALLLAGAAAGLLRGAGLRKVALWAVVGCAGLAAYLAADFLCGGAAAKAAWMVTRQAEALPTAAWSHRLRSLLAFLGGGAVVTALWPLFLKRLDPRRLAVVAIFCFVLFSPFLDLGSVRSVDRATGIALAFGTVVLFGAVLRPCPGRNLWLPWLAAGLAVCAVYWSVMARTVLLAVPPAVFLLAGLLEADLSERRGTALQAASLALVFCLGLSLAWVDAGYAASQRSLAHDVASRYLSQGRRVWVTGHWGLQYYLESAGGRSLDLGRGGWDEVRPGDVVVVPRVNTNVIRPNRRLLADVKVQETSSSVPLRLLCSGRCEGGFYSSVMGFLPFSLSLEPVDTHEIVEVL